MNDDTRIAYGACCTWWDSIHEVGEKRPPGFKDKFGMGGLPCCPRCGGMLFEMENEAAWFASVDRYENDGNPGYRRFAEWLRDKCFPTIDQAQIAYALEKQVHHDPR